MLYSTRFSVSNNSLNGSVPLGSVLAAFYPEAFTWNCFDPSVLPAKTPKGCGKWEPGPGGARNTGTSILKVGIIAASAAAGVAMAAAAVVIVVKRRRHHRHQPAANQEEGGFTAPSASTALLAAAATPPNSGLDSKSESGVVVMSGFLRLH